MWKRFELKITNAAYARDFAKIKPFSLKLNKNEKKRNFLIQNVFTPKENLQNFDFLVEIFEFWGDFYQTFLCTFFVKYKGDTKLFSKVFFFSQSCWETNKIKFVNFKMKKSKK